MGKAFLKKTTSLLQAKRKRKRWQRTMISLSLVVAMVTSCLLIHPAITMERTAICGQEEHTHTKECYEHRLVCGKTEQSAVPATEEKVLNCSKTVHEHGEGCYDAEGQLVCTTEAHNHDDSCYQIIRTEGVEGHTHTDACYEDVLICGKQEHTHTEACYPKETEAATQAQTQAQTQVETAAAVIETQPAAPQTETVTEAAKTETATEKAETEKATEAEKPEARTLTVKNGEYTIQVDCPADAKIPKNAVLSIREIKKNDSDYNSTYERAASVVLMKTAKKIETVRFFDLSISADGKEIQPKATVNVKITFTKPIQSPEGSEVRAVRLGDDADVLATNTNKANGSWNQIIFKAKKLTVYATAEIAVPVAETAVTEAETSEVMMLAAETEETETEAATEVVTEALTEESTEAATEEATEAVTEESTEEATEAVTEESTEAVTEEMTEESTEEPDTEEMTEEDPATPHILTAKGSDYTVEVTYTTEAGIPEGAELQVREIAQGTAEYESYYQQAMAAVQEGDTTSISFARFFDISFVYEGEEIEPSAPVAVKITYADAVEVPEAGEVKSVHFGDEAEVLNVQTNEKNGAMDEVTFDAESFSVYGILGTTNYALSSSSAIDNGSNGISTLSIGGSDTITVEVGAADTISSSVTDRQVGSSTDWWGNTTEYHESWNSSNTMIATVEGVPDGTDGDDQYKQTSATITGIAPGTVTITHIYYTKSNSIIGTRWKENTETITVNVMEPKPEVYTVSFNIGEAAETDGVTVPDSVEVKDGETVSDLPTLVWKDKNGDYVKIFAGWYTDEKMTTEFTDSTPVTSNMTLYASWVDDNAPDMYYVNFYSQDGQTVYLTLATTEGKTVNPASGPTMTGMVFKGWSTTMQNESPISKLNAFDFTTSVSSAVDEGNTLNLYAWYTPAVKVSFISNGGTAVPTQFIAQGEKAESVTTTRTGYTFEGWYTDKDLTQEYNFDTPVNTDITLYAKWTANMVPVTLVYMYENADDDNYSPAGENGSTVVYAPAGSYLSIEKTENITTKNGTHNVRYSDTADGTLTGNARTAATSGNNATIRDVRETYYQYNNATNKRYVNPDGSTVVLVYYNRARITLTFDYNLKSNASIDVNNLISATDQTKYNVIYTTKSNSDYSRFTYKFTAKYKQDITAVWPKVEWVTNNSSDNNKFYSWKCPDDKTFQTSNMYTLESYLFNSSSGLKIEDGVLVGSGDIEAVGAKVQKDWLIYARTTLPGETADFTYKINDKTNYYTIYTEACQLGYSNAGDGSFGYKALDGCTAAISQTLMTQYTNSTNWPMSISNLTVQNGTLKNKFDNVFSKQVADGDLAEGDNCQVLLYNRASLTLTAYTNDTTYNTAQTAPYLYGDWIYNDDDDLLKKLESQMEKEGYLFARWYTDPNFTPGTEYTTDENSRITANLNLYAKWEPNQFRAEYYLYRDDSSPYATQGFAEGGTIDDKFVPAAVQEQFLGWYWYQNGELVPFDFTSTVGQAYVDSDDILKLYAMWEGQKGKVSYLPGKGGNNSTQEVFDDREFQINEAGVQLPKYTDVWTDGSVPETEGLIFVGWKAPNGKIYQPGRNVMVTRQLMQFEAQWSQDAVTLIYHANGGIGANVTETWDRNSVVDIWDNMDATTPHFTRENYELIGWDTDPNATEPKYQLGQGTIVLSENITTLYAIWKRNIVDLTLQKVDSANSNTTLNGAEFELYYTENGTNYYRDADGNWTTSKATLSTAGTGTIAYSNLECGRTYYLVETKAPDGYNLLTESIRITVNSNGVFASTGSTVQKTEEGKFILTVSNTAGVSLPNTGGSGTLPYTLSGLLLMCAAAMMYGFRMRRRERRLY